MLGGHTDLLRGSCTPDWRVSQAYEIKRDVDVRKNTVLCRYPGARGKYILGLKLEAVQRLEVGQAMPVTAKTRGVSASDADLRSSGRQRQRLL